MDQTTPAGRTAPSALVLARNLLTELRQDEKSEGGRSLAYWAGRLEVALEYLADTYDAELNAQAGK